MLTLPCLIAMDYGNTMNQPPTVGEYFYNFIHFWSKHGKALNYQRYSHHYSENTWAAYAFKCLKEHLSGS